MEKLYRVEIQVTMSCYVYAHHPIEARAMVKRDHLRDGIAKTLKRSNDISANIDMTPVEAMEG